MKSLDDTTLKGIAAVDEAIRYASSGRFYSMQEAWQSFVRDANGLLGSNASKTKIESFLKTYCDIDMTNADTGAISGRDAGGSKVKTAESVIPYTVPATDKFNDSYNVQGVTFHVDNPETLTKNQQHMCWLIQHGWMGNALSLIKESYGLSFDEAGAKIKDIHIRFTTPSGGWGNNLASTNWVNNSTLAIYINMDDYTLYDSVNNVPSTSGIMRHNDGHFAKYFDRTLTHELVHALMDANVDNVEELPKAFMEGLADLVHGIDDARNSQIYHVFQKHSASEWKSLLRSTNYYDDGHSDNYTSGYVFLRYLAKQMSAAANKNASKSYSKDGKTVTLGSVFADSTYNMSGETGKSLVQNIDARNANKAVNINGNKAANTIYASAKGGTLRGMGGNDTLVGGAGKDTFYYTNGDGKDTIKSYGSGVDVVKVASGNVTTQISGYDLLLNVGSGSIRIVDGTTKNVLLQEGSKAVRTIKGFAKLPSMASYNSNQTTVTLNASAKNTFDARSYNTTIRTIDGRNANNKVNIYGNSAANTIRAGKAGGVLRGFGGNDTLYGGAGTDTFYYANGEGNDTIYSYESNKDIIQLGSGSLGQAKVYGDDVTFTVGKGSIKVAGGVGKTIKIKQANGKVVTKKYNYLSLPKGASYSASNTKVTMASNYSGSAFDSRAYRGSIRTIDGRALKKNVSIYGNSAANTIYAGTKGGVLRGFGGNDTIYGGGGTDTFYYANGDGNDIIYNYESNKDIIQIGSGTVSKATAYGSDVTLTVGSGSIKIAGGVGKTIKIKDAKGKITTKRVDYRALPTGGLYASNYTKVTLPASFSGTFDAVAYRPSIQTVDASRATKAGTIYGNSKANRLIAGKGGSVLRGGGGNDTLVGGAGADKFYFGKNDGQNVTIENFDANKDRLVLYSSNTVTYGGDAKTQKVWFSVDDGKKKITVNGGFRKFINVTFANGKTNSFQVWNGGFADLNEKKVELNSSYSSGKFEFSTQASWAKNVDASRSSYATNIYGTSDNNIITASGGGGWIYAREGSNTIYCKGGQDTINIANWYGQSKIYNMKKNDIVYLQDVLNYNEVSYTQDKNMLQININGSKAKAQVMGWKQGSSFQLSYGTGSSRHTYEISYASSNSISRRQLR